MPDLEIIKHTNNSYENLKSKLFTDKIMKIFGKSSFSTSFEIKKNPFYDYLFGVLITFHLIIYTLFRYLDQAYQTWDSAGHIGLTMRFADLYRDFFSGGSTTLLDIATESNYYPPLIHQFVAVINILFGYSFQVQLFFIFILFLATLYIIYVIVQEIGFSKRLALFTAFIFSTFPLVGDQARLFHMEIPLTLVLLLCFRFLYHSKSFTDFKNTLGFFLMFSAGQLIKWYAFLFLIVPVVYFLYLGFFEEKNPIELVKAPKTIADSLISKNIMPLLKNIAVGSVLFSVIAIPWYVVNFKELTLLSSLFAVGESDDPQILLSFENIFFYLRGLIAYQMYLLPFIGSVLGTYLAYRKKKVPVILALIQLFIVYVAFTIIQNKNQRYIFSLSPILAFFCAYYLDKVKKHFILPLFLVFTLGAYLFTSFNHVERITDEARAWGIVFTGPFWNGIYNAPDVYSYDTVKPPIEEMYTLIVEDAAVKGIKDIGITPFVDYERVSAANLEMVRNKLRLYDAFVPVPYYQFEPFKSDYEIIKFLRDKNVSYVVVPQWPGPEGLRNFQALQQGVEFMNKRSTQWFDFIYEYDTDNDLKIYRIKSWNTGSEINTCETIGENDGNFGITIEPLASLIMFTGHFDFKGDFENYEPGTLQILEINNYNTYPLGIDVTNLPISGYSYCQRLGTKLKIKNEIAKALFENTESCGEVECIKVKHTKIDGNDPTIKEANKFDVNDFKGEGLDAFLKESRIIPLYEDEYSLEDEIFVEYDVNRN